MTGNLAVVILAAGQGTRMRSTLPKVLHRIAGRPLISYVLDTAQALHPDTVIAVVRHEREQVTQAINDYAPGTVIVHQDELAGTGRAVEHALEALPANFDGSIVVLSGDVPLIDVATLERLLRQHCDQGNGMTLLSAVVADPTGFGRILRDEQGALFGIVEQKDATAAQQRIREINGGIYVCAGRALARALQEISTDNAQGEKYLTDAAAHILASGEPVEACTTEDSWLIAGINDRVQLAEVAQELNRRIVRAHQQAGVTVWDSASTWIDADVRIDADVEILPGSYLHAGTTIARGAVIGPDTTLVNCQVGADAHIRRSEATHAVFRPGVEVGPFSFIRAGTDLGERGKIGAFVETKNARIGSGSKVPHLSYVGDATIGVDSNIGAGTIVANYDGVKKHHSTVGDAVRVGSHNVLVAPVTVADGAYTAAGAVLRGQLAPGSLTVNVAPQRSIEGWVAEHRPGTVSAAAALRAAENGDSSHASADAAHPSSSQTTAQQGGDTRV